MRKLGMFALAFALVLGLTQCKKENTTASNDEGTKVPVTLNANGGNGSRVAVEGSTGVVTFETNDVIHVVSNGVYVGTLTYNGSNFSGEVTEPTEGQKFQFYFLGNKTPEFNSDNTGCSVVISEQTEHLPVISYAPSRENYQVGLTAYNATLLNKCALVKFDVTTSSEAATCITGMKNKVTVNFAENTLIYSQEGDGVITLPAGSGEKWAILLPQEAVEAGEEGSAYSENGDYTGTLGDIPAITDNSLLTAGIEVNVTTEAVPVGTISGKFTINANGDQVYFSKGNLQYNKTNSEWSFMEHQYDMVETDEQDVGAGYANQNIISLFGWGTSGYNHGAVCYQPWSTTPQSSGYLAYGTSNFNLYNQTGKADWGYNAISNGGNVENQWRTLTADEWVYLFNSRGFYSSDFGWRFFWTWGTVNGVQGVILLPDDWWSTFSYDLYEPYWKNRAYHHNTITAADWTNVLEVHGAVFLPASGSRGGNSGQIVEHAGSYWGKYWSSSFEGVSNARSLEFDGAHLGYQSSIDRSRGLSVRLVRNVE